MATRNENRGRDAVDLPVRPANSRRSSYEDILAYLDSCLGFAQPTGNTLTSDEPAVEIEMNDNDDGPEEPHGETPPQNGTTTSADVVIEMPEEEEMDEESDNPISTFLKLCNFLCLVPYRLNDNLERETFCAMVPYIIIHIMHLLHTLVELRRNVMFGAYMTEKTIVSNYILLAQFFIRLLLRICFIHCVTLRLPVIKSFIEYCGTTIYSDDINRSKTRKLVSILIVITGITSLRSVLIFIPSNPFSEQDLSQSGWIIMFYFRHFASSVNSTDYEEYINGIKEDYTPLSTHAIVLGIFSFLLSFFNLCLENTARNFILVLTYLLKQSADTFHVMIPDAIPDFDTTLSDDIKTWFRQLKKISKLLNSIIYILLPLFLADNLLDLVTFYHYSFVPYMGFAYKFTAATQVIRTFVTFFLAERVVNRIMQFRDWLRDEGETMLDTHETTLFLEEISINPIGLGKDPLFVNKAFILSFVGISAAYFMSIVETRDH